MINSKVFEVIEKISNEHCKKTFGYLTKADLRNEIWVICLTLLENYDYSRGELENFLRKSVKNRLVNKFKDITKSVRSPCPRCPHFDDSQEVFCNKYGEDTYSCDKWRNYQLSVESRNSLLNAFESTIERKVESSSFNSLISKETKEYLANKIDAKYKRDFEQLISGGKLSKQRLKKLKKEIERVMEPQTEVTQLTVRGQECPTPRTTKRKKSL